MKKIIALVFAILLVATGCSSYDANVDETVIEQDGYLMLKTDKKLVECHEPGKSGWGGVGNDMFAYPAGQRTWSFTGSDGSEMEPIPVVTADGQTLKIPGFVKFTLTNDCSELYDFHQRVGVKYNAYTSDGWRNFGNDYLGVPITAALNDAGGSEPWQGLYADAAVRGDLERELNETLQNKVNAALGGDWIKIQGVSLSKPLASENLVAGLEAAEKAKLENEAQKNKNETIRTKYQTIEDCRKVASEDWCAIFFLADQGKIDLLPIPNGGNLNVGPR